MEIERITSRERETGTERRNEKSEEGRERGGWLNGVKSTQREKGKESKIVKLRERGRYG